MQRLLCLFLLVSQLLYASVAVAGTDRWHPAGDDYSRETARCIDEWIDSHLQSNPDSPSSRLRDLMLLKNLVKGTLIWTYNYGTHFDSQTFLQFFRDMDDSIKISPLENGGLLFALETSYFKISRDQRTAADRIFPENQRHLYSDNRWFASVLTGPAEISFYFSAVGPFPLGILSPPKPLTLQDSSHPGKESTLSACPLGHL